MKKCPQCGSRHARFSRRTEPERWLGFLLLRPFRCPNCRRRFWWFEPVVLTSRDFKAFVYVVSAAAVVGVVALYMARLPYARDAEAGGDRRETTETPAIGEPDEASELAAALLATKLSAGENRPRPPGSAHSFGGVTVSQRTDNLIELKIDVGARRGRTSRFFLARPPRYAIELEGRWVPVATSSTFLNHPLARKVASEVTDDVVRVIIELGPERGSEPQVEEVADGLIVTFKRW